MDAALIVLYVVGFFAFYASLLIVAHRWRTPKHQHGPWEPVSMNFNPGMSEFEGRGTTAVFLREMAFGCTTITQRCKGCGYTDSHTVIGKATNGG